MQSSRESSGSIENSDYASYIATRWKNSSTIMCLNLSNQPWLLGTNATNQIPLIFQDILPKYNITSLNISRCYIGVNGAKALAKALFKAEDSKTEPALKKLNLSYNVFGDEGTSELAKALQSSYFTILDLNLSQNGIGFHGASDLGRYALPKGMLRKLDLSDNNLGDAGVRTLANSLRDNTSLEVFNLQLNGIGDTGASALATSLMKRCALLELNLSKNSIRHEGALALADALRANARVSIKTDNDNFENDYERSRNLISEDADSISQTIIQLLYNLRLPDLPNAEWWKDDEMVSNTTLKFLDLSSNNIDEAGLHALTQRRARAITTYLEDVIKKMERAIKELDKETELLKEIDKEIEKELNRMEQRHQEYKQMRQIKNPDKETKRKIITKWRVLKMFENKFRYCIDLKTIPESARGSISLLLFLVQKKISQIAQVIHDLDKETEQEIEPEQEIDLLTEEEINFRKERRRVQQVQLEWIKLQFTVINPPRNSQSQEHLSEKKQQHTTKETKQEINSPKEMRRVQQITPIPTDMPLDVRVLRLFKQPPDPKPQEHLSEKKQQHTTSVFKKSPFS